MCIPLAAAGMALSLASSAASFAQQSSVAKARQQHAGAMAARNQKLARASAANNYAAIGDRVYQDAARQGAAAEDIVRDSLRARGRVSAAAAESGASGATVNAVLADFSRQEGQVIARTELQEEFTRDQARIDFEATNIGLESRLVASTPDVIESPNLFGAALGAFSSAFTTGVQLDSAAKSAGKSTLFL